MPRLRAKRAALIVASVIAFATLGTPSAEAHTGSTNYPVRWTTGSSVFYRFETTFPTGAWRDRVKNGAAQWYNVGGAAEPNLIPIATDITPIGLTTSCSNSNFRGPNAIHWENLDFVGTDTLGVTIICYDLNTREIGSFQLGFDSSGPNWYTGTGSAGDPVAGVCQPTLGCQYDAWSVASHEFGHSLGFSSAFGSPGHFSEDEPICPADNGRHTMCPALAPGSEMMRSLEAHDIHTFENAY